MKQKLLVIISLIIVSSCTTNDSFTITKDSVGPLTRDTQISEIRTLFVNDSVIDATGNEEFSTPKGDILVFEKGGKKLVSLTPYSPSSDSKIKFIQLFDSRYTTPKGINLNSTFKDIQDAYTIKRIDNLLKTIVILVEDSDAYFTIDKKHLSANLMFETDVAIEATQIPDDAPIKYFMIGW